MGRESFRDSGIMRGPVAHLKKVFVFIFGMGMLLITQASALAEEYREVPSQIVETGVFGDRAQVKRRVEVNLEKGLHLLSIDGLPAQLMDDSLRASLAKESIMATIMDVKLVRHFLSKPYQEKIKELEEKIKALEGDKRAWLDDIAVERTLEGFLKALQLYSAESLTRELGASLKPSLMNLHEVLEFMKKEFSLRRETIRDAEKKVDELKATIKALQDELQHLRPQMPQEMRSARIKIEALETGNVALDLYYMVSQAQWEPSYEARLEENKERIVFNSYGLVTQKSGEDWEQVKLSLSTAQPLLGGRPLELSPWYLDFARIFPLEAEQKAMGAPFARMEAAEAPAMPLADIEKKGPTVTFTIPGLEAIASDGEPHKVFIASHILPIDLQYTTVPKLTAYAFLRSEAPNPASFSLLPGGLSLFAGSDFLGTDQLPLVAPGEKFPLFFGVDNDIKVKREEVKRLTTPKGLIQKEEEVSFAYKITMENYKARPVKVLLMDQVPVPRNAEIGVKLVSSNPEPDEKTEQGILKWNLSLSPKEKKEIEFQFAVQYPAGKSIIGL